MIPAAGPLRPVWILPPQGSHRATRLFHHSHSLLFLFLFLGQIVMGPLTVPQKILLGYRLDPNSLTEKDWEALPGIGPSVAKKIIDYKTGHGPYPNLDSLMEVKGVGPRTIDSLRQFFDAPNH